MQVVDEDDNEVPQGEVGEIVIRGHNIMKGYWQRPEATEEAMRGGWFHSGDMASVDEDGYFFIVDRKKDLIIRGGYNVYPREVEEVLYEHPKIREAAVVGVPHDEWGEEIGAAVVLNEGEELDAGGGQRLRQGAIAAYKYPRVVWFVDELPEGPDRQDPQARDRGRRRRSAATEPGHGRSPALAPGVRRRRAGARRARRGGGPHSGVFNDALAAQRCAGSAGAQREVERRTRRVLHMANLPTATDVRLLSEQVASLQRELRELEDRAASEPVARARRSRPRRATSGARAAQPQRLRYAGGARRARGRARRRRTLVWRRDTAGCGATAERRVTQPPPVVIVHSLVARSYVLDLYPGNSAVALPARARGSTSSCSTGACPTRPTPSNTLETYVDDGIPARDRRRLRRAGADEVTLLGYCFGGVLALLSRRPPSASCRSATSR